MLTIVGLVETGPNLCQVDYEINSTKIDSITVPCSSVKKIYKIESLDF